MHQGGTHFIWPAIGVAACQYVPSADSAFLLQTRVLAVETTIVVPFITFLAHADRVQHSWSCIGSSLHHCSHCRSHHHCIVHSLAGRWCSPERSNHHPSHSSIYPPVVPPSQVSPFHTGACETRPEAARILRLFLSFVSEPNPARQNRINFSKIDVLSLCAIPSSVGPQHRSRHNEAGGRMKVSHRGPSGRALSWRAKLIW